MLDTSPCSEVLLMLLAESTIGHLRCGDNWTPPDAKMDDGFPAASNALWQRVRKGEGEGLADATQCRVGSPERPSRDGQEGLTSHGRRDVGGCLFDEIQRPTKNIRPNEESPYLGGIIGPGVLRYFSASSTRRASCRASRAISSILSSTLSSSVDSVRSGTVYFRSAILAPIFSSVV
jgi:hypothetical protein